MSNQFNMYSFEQWCKDTENTKYLDLWDYGLNKKLPSEVGFKSNKDFWFKCERGLHESEHIKPSLIIRAYEKNKKEYVLCHKCNSFGQHVIDEYGKEYLDSIWSDKNKFSYYDISFCSGKDIYLKCLNDNTHPDYDLHASTFWRTHNCSYCSGDRVCYTNSLGYLYPDSVKYWSDKNEKSPFDYTPGSKEHALFKCPDGLHDDYDRVIVDQLKVMYRCPECSKELTKGPNHYRWNGGISTENEKIRHSIEYNEWRRAVLKRDNYTCQCCGRSIKKGSECHHFKDFATYVELRFDPTNGISFCKNCHNASVPGSFHNTMGVFGKTEEELEEYINKRRKELGINIPFSIDSYKQGNILKPEDVTVDTTPKRITFYSVAKMLEKEGKVS